MRVRPFNNATGTKTSTIFSGLERDIKEIATDGLILLFLYYLGKERSYWFQKNLLCDVGEQS